jgi:hypothetical protein
LFIKNLPKNMVTTLFRSQNLDLSKDSSFSNFDKLKEHTMRIAITEQRLDEFTNNNRSQREGISELVNTLNETVKLTKKSKVKKAGTNDVIEKLTKGMSKLILTATQTVTEKVTTAIRQMPTYTTNNSTPSSGQTGK